MVLSPKVGSICAFIWVSVEYSEFLPCALNSAT
jgi:hypothetical protein